MILNIYYEGNPYEYGKIPKTYFHQGFCQVEFNGTLEQAKKVIKKVFYSENNKKTFYKITRIVDSIDERKPYSCWFVPKFTYEEFITNGVEELTSNYCDWLARIWTKPIVIDGKRESQGANKEFYNILFNR